MRRPTRASKGGIVQLSRSLATAWAGDNIQVNAVLPGWIDTELTRPRARRWRGCTSGCWRARLRHAGASPAISPGSRCSWRAPASDFVTGAAIPVDGGYSIAA